MNVDLSRLFSKTGGPIGFEVNFPVVFVFFLNLEVLLYVDVASSMQLEALHAVALDSKLTV